MSHSDLDIEQQNKALKGRAKEAIRSNISPAGKQLLRAIADERGTTMTAILEQLIRDYARDLGIKIDKETNS